MKLVHTVTISPDYSLKHGMIPTQIFEMTPRYLMLCGPVKVTDMHHGIVVLRPASAEFMDFVDDSTIKSDIPFVLKLNLVDDLENTPLFKGRDQIHSLLMVGELLEHFAEAVAAVGFVLTSIEAEKEGYLSLHLTIPRGHQAHGTLGAVVCMKTIINAALFSRSLKIGDTLVETEIEAASSQHAQALLDVIRRVMK